jgi:extracellular factor (EF) 3-hydroxypalmitic acid methyl ester biosynthesis protein
MFNLAQPRLGQERTSEKSLLCLTSNDWVLIGAKAKRRGFTLGQEIIREGDQSGAIYIIRRGTASVELLNSRSRVVLAWLKEGDICGDMAFIEKGNATASVIAKEEEVEADEIRTDDLRALFDTFPGLASRFYESLAMVLVRRLRNTSRELVRVLNTVDLPR